MKKITLSAILLAGCALHCYAQSIPITDTSTKKKVKKFDHYIGVQMNELISEVLNFNNTSSTTTPINNNPYLLTYSMNSRKSGWGFRVGLGYNYNQSSTNNGIDATTTTINDLQLRVGVDKAFAISRKWSAGVGIDFVMNDNSDHTTDSSNGGGINPGNLGTVTETKTTVMSYGGGPMGWLRYHLTDRILIGTETSFYYVTGNTKQVLTFDGVQSTPNTSDKLTQGTLNVPVAFFLIVKF